MTRTDLMNLIAKRLGFSSYDRVIEYYTDAEWEADGLEPDDLASDLLLVLETIEGGEV